MLQCLASGRSAHHVAVGRARLWLRWLLAPLALLAAGAAAALNPSGNLEQCANGPLSTPLSCVNPDNWVNGNLNQDMAHWFEDSSVPFRLRLNNFVPGSVLHVVTIEWDSTVVLAGAHHAFDYLTSYNRSEPDADPCAGVAGCSTATVSTWPIPFDPWVAQGSDGLPGTADDIIQVPGVFSLFGGTIQSVSSYTLSGDYSGASSTFISITFNASVANPVLAWSAHVATRDDWAPSLTALYVPGSPYHMHFVAIDGSGGNQDRSLASTAIHTFPELYVITSVVNDNGGTAVAGDFTLTATGSNPIPSSFPGSGAPGQRVVFDPGTYSIGETGPPGYAALYSSDCSGSIYYDQSLTCTVTNDDGLSDEIFSDSFER